MDNNNYIAIGEILKAQGLTGEIKVRSLSDNPERCKKLKIVYIGNVPFKVFSCRVNGNFVFFKLIGIDDRDAAQGYSGKLVYIDRINAVALADGEFFVADLIGCTVISEKGEALGTISAVNSFGSADVITAKRISGKEMRFPFLKKILISVDIANKKFVVNKEQLDGVCVYDD